MLAFGHVGAIHVPGATSPLHSISLAYALLAVAVSSLLPSASQSSNSTLITGAHDYICRATRATVLLELCRCSCS